MTSTDLLEQIWADRRRLEDVPEAPIMPGPAHDPFLALLAEIHALHQAKSADYGEKADPYENFHRSRHLGVSPFLGCLIRLSDKYWRITHLTRHEPQVKEESIKDTLRDLAVYALIALILYDEEHGSHAQPRART